PGHALGAGRLVLGKERERRDRDEVPRTRGHHVDRAEDRPPLTAALVAAQDADGGWGAEPGKRSNTEATALAILALGAASDAAAPSALRRGLTWLADHQRPDGGWPLGGGRGQSPRPRPPGGGGGRG